MTAITPSVPVRAGFLFNESRPRSPHAHWTRSGGRAQLFVVNGSRIFDIDDATLRTLETACLEGDASVLAHLAELGLAAPPYVDDVALTSPPLHALSLAIAQKCNLGCTYCYASQGDFGGPSKNMSLDTALKSVEMLIHGAAPGDRVHLTFLGGEPLANRAGLRQATEHAALLAAQRGVKIGYAITTNGTLLTEADGEFFEKHGFAVTLSLDGLREQHDRQRPFKNGRGSFDQIMERAQPLLAMQRQMQVSVRATVTPDNLQLSDALEHFLGLGFHSVGFSPLLRSSNNQGELGADELAAMLDAMMECGLEFEQHAARGQRYAFTNVVNAMRELHHGTHRPYPCGAGAGYLGVSADGQLAACHRFVGDEVGAMGDLASGIDRTRQNAWLAERHVHRQSPCNGCWARYLCAGGCHHEVIARGRPACDYIRGWLLYCLQAYGRLLQRVPGYFEDHSTHA
jgi:uncharacterized protein